MPVNRNSLGRERKPVQRVQVPADVMQRIDDTLTNVVVEVNGPVSCPEDPDPMPDLAIRSANVFRSHCSETKERIEVLLKAVQNDYDAFVEKAHRVVDAIDRVGETFAKEAEAFVARIHESHEIMNQELKRFGQGQD